MNESSKDRLFSVEVGHDLDLSEPQKDAILEIIYIAFEKKITVLELRPKSKEQGLRILKECAHFKQGLYAFSHSTVVGGVGMNFHNQQFYRYTWKVLKQEFGVWGAFWRYVIHTLAREKVKENEVYIGAIAVSDAVRSQGIGTLLINAVETFAREREFEFLVLEVVNTNHRAHALYKRLGFIDIKKRKTGRITKRAGFTSVFKMKKKIHST